MLHNVFHFLTKADGELLMEKAARRTFPKGETIIEESSRRQHLFILREGMVRVERAHLGQGISIARLGQNEIFGEMSFVEGSGASASIVADEDVVVDVIEGSWINDLLASVPGFSSRFYQSLADILSNRLRQTSALFPALMVEEVAQVQRFHIERTRQPGIGQIPPSLIKDVEAFKESMLCIDRGILERKIDTDEARKGVFEACTAMEGSLQQHVETEQHLEKGIGAYVFRETFPYFMQSLMADRSFSKPRGYAGDYLTIELIYRDEPEGDGRLGRFIDEWWRSQPAARAVRNRRGILTRASGDMLSEWSEAGPMPITSLASGPAREVFDLFVGEEKPNVHITCIDIDSEALRFTHEKARELDIADWFTFARENVIRLAGGRGRTVLKPQQLIYSIGLTDYLEDVFVVNLLNWIYEHLLPGGEVIIGNFDVSNPQKAYMDHILEWILIHRTADDLRQLFSSSKFGDSHVDVRAEEAGVNLFAFCWKK